MAGTAGRRALVTGGAGFIGSHLVDLLLSSGWQVRVIDDFSTGREENLRAARGAVEVLEADVREASALSRAVADIDVVFHQAAIPSVPRSVAEPVLTHAVNLSATVALLDVARSADVRRLVMASSSAVYGESPVSPKTEDMAPAPVSPYGLQKLTCELYGDRFAELHGLEVVALRYFNVFGPRQSPASDYAAVIPRFVCAALSGHPPTIYGDGEQTRDFVYVEDVARANLLAAEVERIDSPNGFAVANVARGESTSLNRLWSLIRDVTGATVEPLREGERTGDIRDSVADVTRARRVFGFEPQTCLADGLRETARNFEAKPVGRERMKS